MSYKVFLSYSTKDNAMANRVKKYFEQITDVSVFLCETSLIFGHVDDAIKAHIIDCDLFMILYSKNSINSNYVQHEIGVATGHNKIIIPILLDNEVKPDGMLQGYNYFPIYDEEKAKVEMPKLYNYIVQESQKKSSSNIGGMALMAIGVIALLGLLASMGSSSSSTKKQ